MRRLLGWSSVFLLSTLSSCVTAPPYRGGHFASTAPQILVADDRGYDTPLTMEQSLSPGQVMALSVHLDQAAYVYVLQRRGGVLDSLYPSSGDGDRLGPGVVRIPNGDAFLRVPQIDREGRLCLLLSAHPVDAAKRACPFEREHFQRHPPIQSYQLAPQRSR